MGEKMTTNEMLDYLGDLFAHQGAQTYLGESVTIAEHMLQSAVFAERAGAPDPLIAAALLHDVGHFANDLPIESDGKIDRKHQDSGAAFLTHCFPESVTEPVRLHVLAKRYLCAVEPAYFDCLSQASVDSLALQGGPLSAAEVEEVERNPYLADAVLLRRADDDGKVVGMNTPPFEDYRDLLERLCNRASD